MKEHWNVCNRNIWRIELNFNLATKTATELIVRWSFLGQKCLIVQKKSHINDAKNIPET